MCLALRLVSEKRWRAGWSRVCVTLTHHVPPSRTFKTLGPIQIDLISALWTLWRSHAIVCVADSCQKFCWQKSLRGGGQEAEQPYSLPLLMLDHAAIALWCDPAAADTKSVLRHGDSLSVVYFLLTPN